MPDDAPFRLFLNPRRGTPGVVVLPAGGFRRAKAEIASWAGYAPAPVLEPPDLARVAGVERVRLVDAARRPCPAPSYAAALGTVHVEDMKRGIHAHLPFGEGDMDMTGVLGALLDEGYRKLVCVELSRDSYRAHAMLADSLAWLKRCERELEAPPVAAAA